MWNEAEFLKQHGLDWFASAGMIIPVPGLCFCVIPQWIPVLLQVPICSQQHFWHSFAGMVSVQDCNTLTCWRILVNKPRDAGSHSQTDVLQDEILHPSSGWTSGPSFRKKSTTVPSRIEAMTVQTHKSGTASVRVNTLCMWFSLSEFELGKKGI